MTSKQLLKLEEKAVKLAKEVLKIVDKIYEEDEIFGEKVADEVNDEIFLRT